MTHPFTTELSRETVTLCLFIYNHQYVKDLFSLQLYILNFRKNLVNKIVFCSANRTRTDTSISAHGILSPKCLPIPPLRRFKYLFYSSNISKLFLSLVSFNKKAINFLTAYEIVYIVAVMEFQ